MRFALAVLLAALILPPATGRTQESAPQRPRYAVLVSIDGVRWEDLFRGPDPKLLTDPAWKARFAAPGAARTLTPFLLSLSERGALIGDRDHGSCARVTNAYWFSYPGYAEFLAGRPNPAVKTNEARPNAEVTSLEWLNADARLKGSVAVVSAWDVVPMIVNAPRSGIAVEVVAGPHTARDQAAATAALNRLSPEPPRVLYVALGDTDTRAHAGQYEAYLSALAHADAFLATLWTRLQADPRTAGATTLIVTTDHGRGAGENGRWRGHGSGRWGALRVPALRHPGSEATFIAAIGPDIRPGSGGRYGPEACATQGQTATTLLKSLGYRPDEFDPRAAAPLDIFR